jgi:polyhydroxybutyrate depolymerase
MGAAAHILDVLGGTRKYVVHIPDSGAGKALPAVVVLHAQGGTPFQISNCFSFNARAEREGFVAVYPEGQDRYWPDVRFADQRESDKARAAADVAFLKRFSN